MRKEVQQLIAEGIQLIWESYKLDPYVQKLSETIVTFQEKVEELVMVGEQLEVDIRSLETCPYSANTFADILSEIQHAVDDLSLKQYSNLHVWVNRLDEEVTDGTFLFYQLNLIIYFRSKEFWRNVYKLAYKHGLTH